MKILEIELLLIIGLMLWLILTRRKDYYIVDSLVTNEYLENNIEGWHVGNHMNKKRFPKSQWNGEYMNVIAYDSEHLCGRFMTAFDEFAAAEKYFQEKVLINFSSLSTCEGYMKLWVINGRTQKDALHKIVFDKHAERCIAWKIRKRNTETKEEAA